MNFSSAYELYQRYCTEEGIKDTHGKKYFRKLLIDNGFKICNSTIDDNQRYQHDFLVDLWNKSARSCGETIKMYAGLKHSSCTDFVNEQGGSVDELQMPTDHARRNSVMKYTEVRLAAKRRIQGKIIAIRTQQE